jgi:tRNA G18 (ribose-2'-O)-methylase SpoU
MRLSRIDDGRDPRLAEYAGVREPTLLQDRGLLIAEGRFVVRRLLEAGNLRLRSLLLNDAALQAFDDLLLRVGHDLTVYVAAPDVITAATGFNMHRGCLALAERPEVRSIDSVLTTTAFVVVLEQVVDPDNIGSVFRSAEGLGADAILLSPGCGDPYYRKAIRTSSGATLVVPFAPADPWPDALDGLRTRGLTIAALTPEVTAVELADFAETTAARGPLAVLLGNEGQGLTATALTRSDVRIRIPMRGALDSLNIATAAGITLYRLQEARRKG